MSGSASIVWTLPFTSRVIRAMGACLPGDAASCGRRAPPRLGRCASLAIANGSRVARLVEGAGIGNTFTQLCCGAVPRCSDVLVEFARLPHSRTCSDVAPRSAREGCILHCKEQARNNGTELAILSYTRRLVLHETQGDRRPGRAQ